MYHGNECMKIRSIGVVAKEGNRDAEAVALRLTDTLVRKGFDVTVVSPLKHRTAKRVASPAELGGRWTDAVMVAGGDGTLLKTLREMDDETPVLGVNVGGRGVLAEIKPEETDRMAEALAKGRFTLEKRIRIQASTGSRSYPPAANEVYISRVVKTRTPTYRIGVEGGARLMQRMDGLLVSTPTGSTGHSLSAGGPLVSERLEVFILTPVSPISRLPPIIVSASPVKVSSNEPTNIVVDGQEVYPVEAGETITLREHGAPAVFMRLAHRPLRQVFNLGFR